MRACTRRFPLSPLPLHTHTGTQRPLTTCTTSAQARIAKTRLPGATGLIFKSSKPKSDLKEKGASAAGGSFSPMVTISGPLVLASGSTSTCLARGRRDWPLREVWALGVPLSHLKSFQSDTKPTPWGFVPNTGLLRTQLSLGRGQEQSDF